MPKTYRVEEDDCDKRRRYMYGMIQGLRKEIENLQEQVTVLLKHLDVHITTVEKHKEVYSGPSPSQQFLGGSSFPYLLTIDPAVSKIVGKKEGSKNASQKTKTK